MDRAALSYDVVVAGETVGRAAAGHAGRSSMSAR